MDSGLAGLLGALIGAGAGLLGTIVAQLLQARTESNKALRAKREQLYTDVLHNLAMAKNNTITPHEEMEELDLTVKQSSEFRHHLTSAQVSLISCSFYCERKERDRVKQALKQLEIVLSQVSGKVDAGWQVTVDGNLYHELSQAYDLVYEAAQHELGT